MKNIITASFTRSSSAYTSSGLLVSNNIPRYEVGKFNQAIMVEEGTTNLVTNPLAKDNLVGIIGGFFGSATGTIERSTALPGDCPWVTGVKVTVTIDGDANLIFMQNDGLESTMGIPVMAGATYTYSIWLYIPLNSGITHLQLRPIEWNASGGVVKHNCLTIFTIKGIWQRIIAIWTLQSTTAKVTLRVLASGTGEFYATACMLEQKPYATSFIDGTRSHETLIIPISGILSPSEGTIEGWWLIPDFTKFTTNYRRLWGISNSDTNGFYSVFYLPGEKLHFRIRSNILNDIVISPPSPGWHYVAARWSTSEMALFIDGQKVGSLANPILPSSFADNVIAINGRSDELDKINTLVGPLRISSRARSDAEIQAFYNGNVILDEYTTAYFTFDNSLNGYYPNAWSKLRKRRITGKVTIDYSDPFLDESITITTNSDANSFPRQVINTRELVPYKWAALDGSWTLGVDALAPETEEEAKTLEMGWWSNSLSGSDGTFSTPPLLSIAFSPRSISTIKVVGDTAKGEFPVNFTVKLYDAADSLLYTEQVTGNNKVSWQKDISLVPNVSKATLEITKWSHSGRCAKIVEFYPGYQETYDGNDIMQIHLLEEREVSSASLPVGNISSNEVDLKLYNRDDKFTAGNTSSPLYGMVRPNKRIRPSIGIIKDDGTTEWHPLGEFWSGEWRVPEGDLYAEVSGRDILSVLNGTTYESSTVQEYISLYNAAEAVLKDAGMASYQYYIDTALQNIIIPTYFMERVSHREALRRIAEAGLAQVYVDRNGVIVITKSIGTLKGFIGRDEIFSKDNPTKITEIANVIEVPYTTWSIASSPQEIYKSSEYISAGEIKTLTITYNKKPAKDITATLSGATLISQKWYSWGGYITIQGISSGTYTLTIYGKPVEKSSSGITIAEDATSIRINGRKVYKYPENDLVQSKAMADSIANSLLSTYSNPRRDLSMTWRGDLNLHLGDIITVPDYGGNTKNYYVVKQDITFDGGLTCSLEGKAV